MDTGRLLQKANQVLAAKGVGTVVLTAAMLAAAPVSAAHAQGSYGVSDSQLQQSVSTAIGNDAKLKGITATASKGVVTLYGDVASEDVRNDAETLVAGVNGVRSIQDNINIGTPNNSAAGEGAANSGTAGAETPPPPAEAVPAPSGQNGMPPPPPADQAANAATQPAQSGQYQTGQSTYNAAPAYPGSGGSYNNPNANGGWGTRGNSHVPEGEQRSALAVSPQQQNASGPVTVPAGTLLNVRTIGGLSTQNLKGGESFQLTAASDIYANGILAIPRGAVLTGQVLESKNGGRFGGAPHLILHLTSLQLGANSYPILSDDWNSSGPSKTGQTATNAAGGALFGALIGAVAGGGVGAGVGALAGGAGGAAATGITSGGHVNLPAEALLEFRLTQNLTVQPLKYEAAEQVVASAPPAPALRHREPRPVYVAPYGYAPYPPPPVYYARPY